MPFIKQLWSDLIYQNLYEDPDLNMMFNRSLEVLVRDGGNKINIPTLSSGISISRTDNLSIGAGLPLTAQDITKSGLQFDIYEYSTEPVLIRNVDLVQSNRELLEDNAQEIAQAFKEHIMNNIMKHIIDNVASGNKEAWTGNAGASFIGPDLSKMEVSLDNAKILENDRYAALQSDDRQSLLLDTNLQAWMAQQQSNLRTGQLPDLFGFGMKKTTLIPKTKADGTIDTQTPSNNDKRNAIGWRKKHMHLVVQTDFEITGSERAEYLGGLYSFTNRYGVYLERDTGAVQSTQQ